MTPTLSVLVCTADRPALLGDLLGSLRAAGPGPWRSEVVVVDNGRDPATRDAVLGHTSDALPMRRVTSPPNDLAKARNTALWAAAGELVLWLDDDQRVGPTFFDDLARAWGHRPAWSEGLRPTVVPAFDGPVAPHVRAFFTPATWPEGARVGRRAFATNGLLAPRVRLMSVPSPRGAGPFDPWFGRRGGEDTDLFLRADAAGLRFSTTRLVTVEERVPAARARAAYMARHAFRVGFTDTHLSRRTRGWLALAAEAVARAGFDLATAPLVARDASALWARALSVCRQAGKLWALAGRDYHHYAPRPGARRVTSG